MINEPGKEQAMQELIAERDELRKKLAKAEGFSALKDKIIKTKEKYIKQLENEKSKAEEALIKAREFIENGIFFGYIKIPTILCDTALKTPGIIDEALETLTGKKWGE